MSKSIAVISSFSTDRLIDAKSNSFIRAQQGGPALFITAALQKMGITPHVYLGEKVLVEIEVHENNEYGKVLQSPMKQLLPGLSTDFAIVSTILDEWDLSAAKTYSGKLFVDVQGYVRNGSGFGRKKVWEDSKDFAGSIFCLKGNQYEMKYVPEEVLADQRAKRMLVTTQDKDSVIIDYMGSQVHVYPEEIIYAAHTIGAGDTFFANFVGKFLEGGNPDVSATFAMQKTAEFLKTLEQKRNI